MVRDTSNSNYQSICWTIHECIDIKRSCFQVLFGLSFEFKEYNETINRLNYFKSMINYFNTVRKTLLQILNLILQTVILKAWRSDKNVFDILHLFFSSIPLRQIKIKIKTTDAGNLEKKQVEALSKSGTIFGVRIQIIFHARKLANHLSLHDFVWILENDKHFPLLHLKY